MFNAFNIFLLDFAWLVERCQHARLVCEESAANHEREDGLTDNCSRSPDRARVVVAI